MAKTKTKKKTRAPRQVYAFVDTNIFLDFYRNRNDASLSLLERLKGVRDRVISTYQVEMEFLKNRQTVLAESLSKIKPLESAPVPAILRESSTHASAQTVRGDLAKKYALIKQRIIKLLGSPKQNDVVFQTLADVFGSQSGHVLTRDMAIKSQIKRRAWKRFVLGYPPRKDRDTTIGDAFNWEWILHCGATLPGRILVVSRDSDFGYSTGSEHFLNDALLGSV